MAFERAGKGILQKPTVEGYGSKIAANIVRPASKIASGVLGLPGLIGQLAEKIGPEMPALKVPKEGPGLTGLIHEAGGPLQETKGGQLTPEFLHEKLTPKIIESITGEKPSERFIKPQNVVEKFADHTLQGLFYAATLGPGVIASLPTTIGSALGSTAAEELGGGAGAQLAGGLAGGIAGQAAASKGVQLANEYLKKRITGYQPKTIYNPQEQIIQGLNKDKEAAREAVKGLKAPAPELHKMVNETLERAADAKVEGFSHIKDRLQGLLNALQGRVANAEKLWEQNELLNEIIYDRKLSDAARKSIYRYLQPIRVKVLETMESFAAKNPKFGEPYKAYKTSFSALRGSDMLQDFAEENPGFIRNLMKKYPAQIVSTLLGSGAGYYVNPILGAGIAGTGFAGRQAVRIGMNMARDPRAAKIYKEIGTNLFMNNIPQVERYLNSAGKLAQQKQKELKPTQWVRGKGKLIR